MNRNVVVCENIHRGRYIQYLYEYVCRIYKNIKYVIYVCISICICTNDVVEGIYLRTYTPAQYVILLLITYLNLGRNGKLWSPASVKAFWAMVEDCCAKRQKAGEFNNASCRMRHIQGHVVSLYHVAVPDALQLLKLLSKFAKNCSC